MTRPQLVSALAVFQWVWTALYGFLGAYLLLGGVREVRAGDDWASRMIVLGSACAVLTLLSLLAGYGIWKLRLWGQFLALILVAFWVAVFAYAWYDDGDWEHDVLPVLIPFAILLTLHLLPATWRAFRAVKLETPAPTI
jgi:hypothetical protein